MRSRLPVICLVSALLLVSVTAATPGVAASPLATTVIQVPPNTSGLFYSPSVVLINMGDTVEWDGNFTFHPLASDDNLWPVNNSGTTFSHTFNQPGTFRFYCMIHGGPGGVGMSGEVIVSSTPLQHVFLPLTSH